jgi:RNA polymerase sigma-70 factor (ECF subfamily)
MVAMPRARRAAAPTPDADMALVQRLLQGDEAAFTAIVERIHGPLIRFVRLFVSSQDAAEDVVQDTWVGVLNGLHRFEGRSGLKAWIFSIAANRAKSRAVRDKRIVTFSALSRTDFDDDPAVGPDRFGPDGSWASPPARWEDTPEKTLLRRETMAVVEDALTRLPVGQRAVVLLRDVEGLDAAEVCNMLAISETNQRVLLHRGRSKVRAALERYWAERQPC